MRYLIAFLIWIMACPVWADDMQGILGGAGSPQGEYFGNQDTSGISWHSGVAPIVFNGKTDVFVCPGSGTRRITELKAYVKSGGGTPGTITVGIFNSATRAFVCESLDAVTVSSTIASWVGDSTLNGTCTCTGGSSYIFAVALKTSDVNLAYKPASGASEYKIIDYTDSFPATLPTGPDSNALFLLKAKVE